MFELFSNRTRPSSLSRSAPNRWDWALLPLVLAILALMAYGASQMSRPFAVGEELPISLDPVYLPYYLLRTILRMFTALAFSLLFSFVFAAIAAKYRTAERPWSRCWTSCNRCPSWASRPSPSRPSSRCFPATCWAWSAPPSSPSSPRRPGTWRSACTSPCARCRPSCTRRRACSGCRAGSVSGGRLPYATPGLLWNMMMSMSGGWFFLVAAEAISVAGQDIKLPGIGSYIAVAIESENGAAIAWAILAMMAGILLYDQLFFRPLLAWADKFRFEESQGDAAQQSWLLDWTRRSRWMMALSNRFWARMRRALGWFSVPYDGTSIRARAKAPDPRWSRVWDSLLAAGALLATYKLVVFVHEDVGWSEVLHVVGLGGITLARVLLLIGLASLFWVPVAVWIGLRPKYSQKVQAVAQFLAAFPVNLLFPLVVFVMVAWKLNPDIWLSPLMVFGTQWYILFNVVAGASTIPNELRLASANLGLKGWLLWRRVYLPAVFPSFITGAITASGGSWNASIVSEYVSWGDTSLMATGLGSYIKQMTEQGDFHRIALGIGVMCVFVMLLNRFFWRKLYLLAQDQGR